MRLAGVKVVNRNGEPPRFYRGLLFRGWLIAAVPLAVAALLTHPFSFRAYLGHLFDVKVLLAAVAAIALDAVVMLVDRDRRALHDFIAGTRVVATRADLLDVLRRS
jgi:uncharacterized RDD family membrane protein YckC